jgi:hypothetical protein
VILSAGVNDMLEQSPAAQTVQNFGHTAFHAGAFARRHHHHIHDCHELDSLYSEDYQSAYSPLYTGL